MIFLSYNLENKIRAILVVLIILGILSDIFDGIIARKLKVSSEKIRRLDSQVDVIFWLCVGWCVWILNPKFITENQFPIILVFVMEGLTYVFSFMKFGKETCTHAILSKLWGISLMIVFISIIGFSYLGIAFYGCIAIGIIAHIDVYMIIYFLPRWTHDVPSCYHAYLLKKGIPIKKNKLFNG